MVLRAVSGVSLEQVSSLPPCVGNAEFQIREAENEPEASNTSPQTYGEEEKYVLHSKININFHSLCTHTCIPNTELNLVCIMAF